MSLITVCLQLSWVYSLSVTIFSQELGNYQRRKTQPEHYMSRNQTTPVLTWADKIFCQCVCERAGNKSSDLCIWTIWAMCWGKRWTRTWHSDSICHFYQLRPLQAPLVHSTIVSSLKETFRLDVTLRLRGLWPRQTPLCLELGPLKCRRQFTSRATWSMSGAHTTNEKRRFV